MSLTKAALAEHAKPRVELIKADDVPGLIDDVWVRSYPQSLMSSRKSQLIDADGNFDSGLADRFQIIDQIMLDENEPMFTDEDIDSLGDMDGERLAPLMLAIQRFNFGDPKKTTPSESNGSSTS